MPVYAVQASPIGVHMAGDGDGEPRNRLLERVASCVVTLPRL